MERETAESALGEQPMVAGFVVVGASHDIKDEAIYSYVTLKRDSAPNDQLYTRRWFGSYTFVLQFCN